MGDIKWINQSADFTTVCGKLSYFGGQLRHKHASWCGCVCERGFGGTDQRRRRRVTPIYALNSPVLIGFGPLFTAFMD